MLFLVFMGGRIVEGRPSSARSTDHRQREQDKRDESAAALAERISEWIRRAAKLGQNNVRPVFVISTPREKS
jgi:broad specificity phosphatase PhoE